MDIRSSQKAQDVDDFLPPLVRTLRGSAFDPRSTRWSFHDGVETFSFNFKLLPAQVSPALVLSIKRVLIWYSENLSPGQLATHFSNIKRFLRFVSESHNEIEEILVQDLMNYRASLSFRDEWYLGAVVSCFKKWYELKIPGVSKDAILFLDQIRLRGSVKGEAILTMDANNGPFTNIEVKAIRDALNDAYANGSVSLEDFVLVYLFILLGQRSRQFALLKVCDLFVCEVEAGRLEYVLRIPRVKQGAADCRADFTDRVITSDFGELLYQYANLTREGFVKLLEDPRQAPLFPTHRSNLNQPPQFKYHKTSKVLAQSVTKTLDRLKVWSERTGQQLNITTTRFRRTIGTRAAKEGHGELIIAELLDHTDTQSVGVYVRATPEIIERIDEAISLKLAPLARAFKGTLINNERDALRGNDPSSRIVDPRFNEDFKPMGNCGRHGSCHFHVPIACYTCKSFQAWSDGPHEKVLTYLVEERERQLKSTDERIASINDRTILAVAQVVRLCRGSLSNDGNVQ
ncbi:site-specific integrase [Undibacterium danionis]|uniref:Site-specific integrase n=1 Tax=Undibacterium danionis TaxID=1812100 RepID=A0ABV6IE21_9BURK